jgi:hypothetical protein
MDAKDSNGNAGDGVAMIGESHRCNVASRNEESESTA